MSDLAQLRALAAAPSPFEEQFLGGPVWRISFADDAPMDLFADAATALVARARAEDVRLMFARLDVADAAALAALAAAGFRRVETLVTLARPIEPVPDVTRDVAPAAPADVEPCVEIGRTSFATDRYHADPAIADDVADAMKARWVENALAGRADAALVAHDAAGRAVGFNLLRVVDGTPIIDLIAVAASARGQGYGAALIAAGLAHYRGRAATMRVGTQSDNGASLALYRAMGFAPVDEQATVHWTPSA